MEITRKEFLKSEKGRDWFIKKCYNDYICKDSWQNHHTPYMYEENEIKDFCENIIKRTLPLKDKKILILFNLEFLEELIYKFHISKRNMYFITGSNLKSQIAKKIYRVETATLVNKQIKEIGDILKKMERKFDLCFSNPPYGVRGQLFHLKILEIILPLCNELVFVHPAEWLISNRPNQDMLFKRIKKKINGITKEIDIFNPNIDFDIERYAPCCITYINKMHNGNIRVDYFKQCIYEVDDINDITIFCESWKPIVKPFVTKIEKYISKIGNIYWSNHRLRDREKTKPNPSKVYCEFTANRRGSWGSKIMLKKDQFDIIDKNKNYQVNHNKLISSKMSFCFDTEIEMNNFLEYLQTDFVKFCLSTYKTCNSLYDGCMSIIPLMDFKQKWTNKKLYNFFNIDNKTITYIQYFLTHDDI